MSVDIKKEIEHLFDNSKFEEARKRFVVHSNTDTNTLDEEQLNELLNLVSHRLSENNIAELFALRGLIHDRLNLFAKAILDYNTALKLNPETVGTYNNRGRANYQLNKLKEALLDYNTSISLDPDYSGHYSNRGIVLTHLKNYEEAILDYNKAISLSPAEKDYYNGRGIAHFYMNNFEKAILDYSKAISLNSEFENAYFNRSLVFKELGQYSNEVEDLDKVIVLNPNKEFAHFNKAQALVSQGKEKFPQAIKVLKYFISISNDDYFIEIAQQEIKELEEELEDKILIDLVTEIDKIKALLEYKGSSIAHFTNLTVTKALLIGYPDEKNKMIPSRFRLSEANYMNDTSEGEKLKKFIGIDESIISKGFVPYMEKPFLASFVAEKNRNNLTLWRMYAKTKNIDGNGCALVLKKDKLLDIIKSTIIPPDETKDETAKEKLQIDEFSFYNVAYIDSKGKYKGKDSTKMNTSLVKIKKIITSISKEETKLKLALERLVDIEYLFKGVEYQHESEIRLILSKTGKAKHIKVNTEESDIPRVYLEVGNILPAVEKVVVGPKVERSEEWASAFNYSFLKSGNENIEIELSKLPYK